MPSASTLRQQIESTLANRIPSALTPPVRHVFPVADTGIESIDRLLEGGLPIGAITEMVGPECSGRTSLAISFLAQRTLAEKYCAWVDVSNTFDPESAAANGVDLKRVLWIRCGVHDADPTANLQSSFKAIPPYRKPSEPVKGLHGASYGPHPRTEIKGISEAVDSLLTLEPPTLTPSITNDRVITASSSQVPSPLKINKSHPKETTSPRPSKERAIRPSKPWSTMNQALLVTDILLQGGGFDSIVLDMGGIAPDHVSRVPLATWFRYRSAAQKSQSCVLLLTQHSSTQSSAELVLNFSLPSETGPYPTVLTSLEYNLSVTRTRNSSLPANVLPLKKPPRRESGAAWQSHTAWGCSR